MTRELEEGLVRHFPQLFRNYHGDPKATCMHLGFQHNDGWYELVRGQAEALTEISRLAGFDFVATQVKEKLGSLDFDFSVSIGQTSLQEDQVQTWQRIVSDLSLATFHRSLMTCELCGSYAIAVKIVFATWRAKTDAVFTRVQGFDRQEDAGWLGEEARRRSS